MHDSIRLNQYRVLWVFVSFDLPTETKMDRKNYARFRKSLHQDGFVMLQYSVYIRHSTSRENASVHIRRVKSFLPPKGQVLIYTLTDKQFEMIEFYRGIYPADKPATPQQLELF
ncbi:MAG: CRISPR-associated endonuclease Cas2 [Candidatus Cloacimonetes bacterium]|nr:CRISPR-associated endonuclease Cas2 [Bacteroidales bacterium]MDD3097946.1 CRISPR-associated endonuclease Cas2 [Candidatus Cloacimonadota bacterium]